MVTGDHLSVVYCGTTSHTQHSPTQLHDLQVQVTIYTKHTHTTHNTVLVREWRGRGREGGCLTEGKGWEGEEVLGVPVRSGEG